MSDFYVFTKNGFGTTGTSKCTTKKYCPEKDSNKIYGSVNTKSSDCAAGKHRNYCNYFDKNACNIGDIEALEAKNENNSGKCKFNTSQFNDINQIINFKNHDFVKDQNRQDALNIITQNFCTKIINNGESGFKCSDNVVDQTPTKCSILNTDNSPCIDLNPGKEVEWHNKICNNSANKNLDECKLNDIIYYDHCKDEKNYPNDKCQGWYATQYNDNQLNTKVQDILNTNCSKDVLDDNLNIKKNVSKSLANLCGCFLNNQFYKNYTDTVSKKVDIDQSLFSNIQCFNPYCSNASLLPEHNKRCPDIQIQKCTISNNPYNAAGGNILDNKSTTDNNIQCIQSNSDIIPKNEPIPSSQIPMTIVSKIPSSNKTAMIIIITIISFLVLISMGTLLYFSLK